VWKVIVTLPCHIVTLLSGRLKFNTNLCIQLVPSTILVVPDVKYFCSTALSDTYCIVAARASRLSRSKYVFAPFHIVFSAWCKTYIQEVTAVTVPCSDVGHSPTSYTVPRNCTPPYPDCVSSSYPATQWPCYLLPWHAMDIDKSVRAMSTVCVAVIGVWRRL
jgi:hypothetical protein